MIWEFKRFWVRCLILPVALAGLAGCASTARVAGSSDGVSAQSAAVRPGMHAVVVDPTDTGRYPLLVAGEHFAGIDGSDTIVRLWWTLEPAQSTSPDGVHMTNYPNVGSQMLVKTCADAATAFRRGLNPANNLEVAFFAPIQTTDAVLSCLSIARRAKQSGFHDADVVELFSAVLPPNTERCSMERTKEHSALTSSGLELKRTSEEWVESIRPLFFGDLDGDGWEDVLVEHSESATQATFHATELRAFTRRGTGPLIELCDRVPSFLPFAEEWREREALWQRNLGLVPNRAFTLRGTCKCSLDNNGHELAMTLTSVDGLLHGTKTCSREPRPIAMAGSLSETQGILLEYGLPDGVTAVWSFGWSRQKGVDRWFGGRRVIGGFERDRFNALMPSPARPHSELKG